MPYVNGVPQTGMYSYLGRNLAESAQGFLDDSLNDLRTRRFTPQQIAGNLNYRWNLYQNDSAARQSAIALALALINAGLKPSVLSASLAAAAGYTTPSAPAQPIVSVTPPTPPPTNVGGGQNGITVTGVPVIVSTVPSPATPTMAQPPSAPASITVMAPPPGPTVVAGTSDGTPLDTSGPSAAPAPAQASIFGKVSPTMLLIGLAVSGFLALKKSKGSRRY